MVLVCTELHKPGCKNTGIVYNLHHAHHRVESFAEDLNVMPSYLLCLNFNGMVHPKDHDITQTEFKIRPIKKGQLEEGLFETVIKSGYKGHIEILGHVASRDVEKVLNENLSGLDEIFRTAEASSESSE